MYDKSLDDINYNHLDKLPQDLFNDLTEYLTYKPTLAKLSVTSKGVRLKILKSPCGNHINELNSLRPSYTKNLNYTVVFLGVGGVVASAALGFYLNHDSFLSPNFGGTGGFIISGMTSFALAGYLTGGVQGAKQSVYSWTSSFAPMVKLFAKIEFIAMDKLLSCATQSDWTTFQDFIEDSPKELLHKTAQPYLTQLSIFAKALENIAEKQEELSLPILRKSSP